MRRIIVLLLKCIGGVVSAVILYLLLGYLIPFILVKAEKTDDPKVVEAYILTNGVHTDLVVPVKSEWADWSQKIPFDVTKGKNTDFKYVSFGWGDKGFYLDTPTWADLKFSTAFKAAFWMGQSAMHTTYYHEMTEGEDCKRLCLQPSSIKGLSRISMINSTRIRTVIISLSVRMLFTEMMMHFSMQKEVIISCIPVIHGRITD